MIVFLIVYCIYDKDASRGRGSNASGEITGYFSGPGQLYGPTHGFELNKIP